MSSAPASPIPDRWEESAGPDARWLAVATPLHQESAHQDLSQDLQSRLPQKICVIRILGHGRAAKAQLVDAVMPSGEKVRCVEKVFAPGRLTRWIYRASFQAPFAYQNNIHAIQASFYRRRVAAAIVTASEIDASVAAPLYVRYCEVHRAWVLAAQWIDGRGIRPAPANPGRCFQFANRLLGKKTSCASSIANDQNSAQRNGAQQQPCGSEISELVSLMNQIESVLITSGLVGSGWQVSPRAMVSTANLLRTGDGYTIVDLESGIPSVLVPKYIMQGVRGGSLPPFDDLDQQVLRSWLEANRKALPFRLGLDGSGDLEDDLDSLVEHSEQWKASEISLLRRPWQWLGKHRKQAYQGEFIRQLTQHNQFDGRTAGGLMPSHPRAHALWWSGLIPLGVGKRIQRLIGNAKYRTRVWGFCSDREDRKRQLEKFCVDTHQRLIQEDRLPLGATALGLPAALTHHLTSKFLPCGVQRYLSDPDLRRSRRIRCFLLLVSPTYQSWFGQNSVSQSIDRWHGQGRISNHEAEHWKRELCGHQVRTYIRGFGLHLALKSLAPLLIPVKLAGVAAYASTGNPLFLLPFLTTPALRFLVTLQSRWMTRNQSIAHAEAMGLGWLPVVGLIAFPIQMFASRPELSTFLIRDFASKLGQKLPIYGGSDSRTEMAAISAADYVLAIIGAIAKVSSSVTNRMKTAGNRSVTAFEPSPTVRAKAADKSRLAGWIERLSAIEIAKQDESDRLDSDVILKRAA